MTTAAQWGPLLDFLELDQIIGMDWETYWAKDYTLSNMATSEYIYDPRFKAHMCSVQWHDEKKAEVLSPSQVKEWAREVDWKRTGILAHHTHFDGLINTHHFKITPKFWLDTMSMGRALLPVTVGDSLLMQCAAFGIRAKKGAGILVNTQGKLELSPAEYKKMATYAGGDIENTWKLFWKLMPFLPPDELKIIDMTVRMFCEPAVVIDPGVAQTVSDSEKKRKADLLAKLNRMRLFPAKVTTSQLSSNDQFAPMLESLGVDVPYKVKPALKKRAPEDWQPKWPDDFTYALGVSDLEFKSLLKHEDKRVRALVEARVAAKSTNLEKKSAKMAERGARGLVPIYLKYSGAKTHRWSGADKINWQNMNRGSDMRKAIKAPPGYVFIIADQAQIEARLNAWYAGQQDIVEAFANKHDVYKLTACGVYGIPIERVTAEQRFVGKTAVLGLGYQAGAPRFAGMLRIGQFGPPVDITDQAAKDFVTGWRQSNYMIVKGWKETQNLVASAFMGKTKVEHRHGIVYEGVGDTGYMHHIPTGMSIRYDKVELTEKGSLRYVSKYRRNKKAEPTIEHTKLYGGIEVENRTQFLARMILANQMIIMRQQMPKVRLCNTTHDEVLLLSPIKTAEANLRRVKTIMTTPFDWCEGLPFGVDAKINEIYDKA